MSGTWEESKYIPYLASRYASRRWNIVCRERQLSVAFSLNLPSTLHSPRQCLHNSLFFPGYRLQNVLPEVSIYKHKIHVSRRAFPQRLSDLCA